MNTAVLAKVYIPGVLSFVCPFSVNVAIGSVRLFYLGITAFTVHVSSRQGYPDFLGRGGIAASPFRIDCFCL